MHWIKTYIQVDELVQGAHRSGLPGPQQATSHTIHPKMMTWRLKQTKQNPLYNAIPSRWKGFLQNISFFYPETNL